MSANCACLFVYGTLRRASAHEFARLLRARATYLGQARMPGRLYQLTRYPGAVLSDRPEEWVRGEVFQLDGRDVLAALDDYEGADFQRVVTSIHLEDGRQIEAWVYVYRGPEQGTRIASGDWFGE